MIWKLILFSFIFLFGEAVISTGAAFFKKKGDNGFSNLCAITCGVLAIVYVGIMICLVAFY